MRRPLLALAALFGLGCGIADPGGGPGQALALLVLAAWLLAAAAAAPGGRRVRPALGGAAFALGAAAAIAEGRELETSSLRRLLATGSLADGPVRVSGVVRGDSQTRGGRLVLVIDVQAVEHAGGVEACSGRARVEVGGDAARPRLLDGDRVAAWVRLRAARAGEPVRDGVVSFGYVKSARLVERSPGRGAGVVRRTASQAREAARQVLLRSILPGTERGLVLAMVLGDRSELDEATAEAFRASGTYHVLALSGAQVALLAGLLVWGLGRLGTGPWTRAGVAAGAIGFYAVFVGGDVPIVRAALMASAVLLGRALDLDADAANLLGLAALVLLVHRPTVALDAGFQLSFGATLGLLAFAGPLSQGVPRLPLRLDLAVVTSVAAQCALGPLLAARFHRVAPAAVLLNIAAVPLSAAVLLVGLGVLLVAPFSAAGAALVGDVAWVVAHALRASGDLGPLGPWLDLRVPGPSLAALALHVSGLGFLYRGCRGRGLGLLLACHLALAASPLSTPADGRLHLTVIDVGQGDSLLLRSPTGRALVVDAGGSRDPRFDPGERKVAPELWRRGVRRIDTMVITHAHPDHVGGAPFLLQAFRVGEWWEGPAVPSDPAWRAVEERVSVFPLRRMSVGRGRRLIWDGVELTVLGPFPAGRVARRVRNEDSIVLEAALGEVRILLTGDVAGEAEERLSAPRAFVLKVPHHGSRSSSEPAFVARVAPRLAIVSVGAHNPFGHPHPEVLERYARAGALLLRTDRDGTIEVATDGRRVWVRAAGEGEERRIR